MRCINGELIKNLKTYNPQIRHGKNVGSNKRTFIQYSRAVIKGPWQLNWKIEDTFSSLLISSSSSITVCLVFRFKPVSLRNFSKKHFCNADPVRTFRGCQKCFYITSTWKNIFILSIWKTKSLFWKCFTMVFRHSFVHSLWRFF